MVLAMLDVLHDASHMLAQGLQFAIIVQRGAQHLQLQVMRLCSQQGPHVRRQLLHAQAIALHVRMYAQHGLHMHRQLLPAQ